MSDGILVDDAIAWELISEDEPPLGKTWRATIGGWSARVWRSDSPSQPWRGKLRRNGYHHKHVRWYRTEAAALAATGKRLRKAAT